MYCFAFLGVLLEASNTVLFRPVLGNLACFIRTVNVLSLISSHFFETSALTVQLTASYGAWEHLDDHLTGTCLETRSTQDLSQGELVPLEHGLFHDVAEACQILSEAQC